MEMVKVFVISVVAVGAVMAVLYAVDYIWRVM